MIALLNLIPESRPAAIRPGIYRLTILLIILVSSACGMSDDRAESMSRSIFTDPDLAIWELGTAPLLEIGGLDEREGYALGNVVGAVLLRDHLVIADRIFGEVRFYAASGELTARSGRSGAGPGEYRQMSAIASYDDSTVIVWDFQLRRFTRLALNGEVLTTIPADLSAAENLAPAFLGVLDGGHLVFHDERPTSSLREEITGERRDSIRHLVLEPDGSWNGRAWSEPGTEVYFTNDDGSWGSTPVIFGRSTMAATAGARIVVGTNDTLCLSLRTSDGSIVHTAALPLVPMPVTDEWGEKERQRLYDEENRSILMRYTRRAAPDAYARLARSTEARIRKLPSRRTLPAFSDLRADSEGNVWIAQYTPPGASERSWIVLDSLLEPIARIEVPLSLEILDLRGDRLVSRSTDDLGRQTVAVYPIKMLENPTFR
jgi:hypothetical protein